MPQCGHLGVITCICDYLDEMGSFGASLCSPALEGSVCWSCALSQPGLGGSQLCTHSSGHGTQEGAGAPLLSLRLTVPHSVSLAQLCPHSIPPHRLTRLCTQNFSLTYGCNCLTVRTQQNSDCYVANYVNETTS